ncbi:MAG: DUF4293 domain-containing protein [Alistipes sp.]|nr:DUF4293 domain-containing protein [Alistipes sp.]
MIQRIQSVYLFVASVMMFMMLSFPMCRFLVGDEEFVIKAFGIYSVTAGDAMVVSLGYFGVLVVVAAVLPLVTLFLYKNRILQIRLCFMEMVFLIGAQVMVVYTIYNAVAKLEGPLSVSCSIVDLFPLASLILTWLAYKRIVRDEALVRSLDRIR